MASTIDESPYRSTAAQDERRKTSHPLPDTDILVLLLVVSPALLAAFIHAMLKDQEVGAGPTVCGIIAVLAVAVFVSAWRRRR
jgi:hypothetical protein